MSYQLTTLAPQPAADWVTANTWLDQFCEGTESDTGKTKRGPGYWNDLGYYSPGGGGGALQMATTTVDWNVGTKQAVLPAVPSGKSRIVTHFIIRNASDNMADLSAVRAGFNAAGDDWATVSSYFNLSTPDYSFAAYPFDFGIPVALPTVRGNTGDVFGVTFVDTLTAVTVDVDVFYYDVNI